MGDVASGFLGFTFAVLPQLAAQTGKEGGRALIAGASFVGVFIFDAGHSSVSTFDRMPSTLVRSVCRPLSSDPVKLPLKRCSSKD